MRLRTIVASALAGLNLAAANQLRPVTETPSVSSSGYATPSPAINSLNASVLQMDATTMRRTLYLVGYSSSAAGTGLAMQAFNAEAWCLSNTSKAWCPQAVNSTVSGIVSQVVNDTGANKVRILLCLLSIAITCMRICTLRPACRVTVLLGGERSTFHGLESIAVSLLSTSIDQNRRWRPEPL